MAGLINVFSIYSVDYDGNDFVGASASSHAKSPKIIQFTLADSRTTFFSAIKQAVEMSVGLQREFVVVPELSNGIDRFSKTNPNRLLDFHEICLKNCFHVKGGRFHFKQTMTASPVLRKQLFLDSVLFPGFSLAFPLASPMLA
jgi:hypothetical protein